MNKLLDKLIIFMFCVSFYILNVSYNFMIVPILISIIISALLSYFENKLITITGFIIYICICIYEPLFIFFIPLICYDVLIFEIKWICFFALIPILINSWQTISTSNIIVVALIVVAYFLKYRTVSLQSAKKQYNKLRDSAKEISMLFEKKNKELMEKQDYEIKLVTLHERNRIARDIHDNVGHMLSSSILQIGALLVTSKDEKVVESLRSIKETLSSAMDSIRNSVHDLHDESIDLYTEIQFLINNFKFCRVDLDYDIESSLEKNLKYCFISVTKEALSNIIKHSNATKVSIILREHPAFFQLIIKDNGTQSIYKSDNGIGIKNISDRVSAFNGNVNITNDNGFRIFISIPKSQIY